jgi:hypothetical protein
MATWAFTSTNLDCSHSRDFEVSRLLREDGGAVLDRSEALDLLAETRIQSRTYLFPKS